VVRDRDAAREQAAAAATAKAELEAKVAELSAARDALGLDLAFVEAGLQRDPTARVVAQALYATLPAEGRPSVADWVRSLGEQMPPALAAYRASPPSSGVAAAPSSQTSAPEGGGTPAPPRATGASAAPPPVAAPADALRAATRAMQDAVRAGSAADIARHRAEVERLSALVSRGTMR
jgi:hypothetical protein